MSIKTVAEIIKEKQIKFVDLRFTDTRGKEQHVTVWVDNQDDLEHLFKDGKAFDASSIVRFTKIDNSDMILRPDPETAMIDPFFDEPTLVLTCNVIDPMTMSSY